MKYKNTLTSCPKEKLYWYRLPKTNYLNPMTSVLSPAASTSIPMKSACDI